MDCLQKIISLNQEENERLQFEKLLQRTKDSVLKKLETIENPSSLSGPAFELITFENTIIEAKDTQFESKLIQTDNRDFPDITAGSFGIEVKVTKKDHWTSTGNSVKESSRIDTVKHVYMFFGKLGGNPDIKFRKYEECLNDIGVTHSPRYRVDMQIKPDESIFAKMDISYNEIQNSPNPIKLFKDYKKGQMKEGEELWWIDDNTEDQPSLDPIIKSFMTLDAEKREDVMVSIFIYFPEIVSNSIKKFERVPAYLVSQYGVVTPNLRDYFTAGGQVDLSFNGKNFAVPQIIGKLIQLASKIKSCLEEKNKIDLSNYWQKDIENFINTEEAWLDEIDSQAVHMGLPAKISELYLASLKGNLQ